MYVGILEKKKVFEIEITSMVDIMSVSDGGKLITVL